MEMAKRKGPKTRRTNPEEEAYCWVRRNDEGCSTTPAKDGPVSLAPGKDKERPKYLALCATEMAKRKGPKTRRTNPEE